MAVLRRLAEQVAQKVHPKKKQEEEKTLFP